MKSISWQSENSWKFIEGSSGHESPNKILGTHEKYFGAF